MGARTISDSFACYSFSSYWVALSLRCLLLSEESEGGSEYGREKRWRALEEVEG